MDLLTSLASDLWSWLLLLIGLGFVIFVHELGHFAVAKWVGVLVERFSIGFGPVLWSFRRGDTEYALSAIPFGGYVKMLGQDDNPANTQRERERSTINKSASAGRTTYPPVTSAGQGSAGQTTEAPTVAAASPLTERGQAIAQGTAAEGFTSHHTVEQADQWALDPRSYQAKTVLERMAIISAGVIMNIIFGFLFFLVVFNVGVPYTPALIATVEPGDPAWQVGIERGDRILRVDGEEIIEYEQFHQAEVLSDRETGLDIEVLRGDRRLAFHVVPRMADDAPRIGVSPSYGLELDMNKPVVEGYAASKAEGEKFRGGDRITHVDGIEVQSYPQFVDYLTRHSDKEVMVTVRRVAKKGEPERSADVRIPPQPLRDLGLKFQMGRITAIQHGSPAARAGIEVGDVLQSVAGEPFDPLRLPDLISGMAGREVELEVKRQSQGEELLRITLVPEDRPGWATPPRAEGNPLTVPAIGIAYQLVQAITEDPAPDSPAYHAGLRKDDRIIAVSLHIPPEPRKKKVEPKPVPIDDEHELLPIVFWKLQHIPDVQVEFKVKRDGKELETKPFTPQLAENWFAPFRGINLARPLTQEMEPQGFSRAIVLGYKTTKSTMTSIYLMLRRLIFSRTVSPKMLFGPIGIVDMGHRIAEADIRMFIKFLAMLSVNLAIINFLPIPILDGGHMVLLAWEGIRGKPASERVVIAANYCGLLVIICLFLFVTWNDVSRWLL